MVVPSPSLRRRAPERFQAWLVTGPLGHLWSVLADIATFAARSLLTRARQRPRRD